MQLVSQSKFTSPINVQSVGVWQGESACDSSPTQVDFLSVTKLCTQGLKSMWWQISYSVIHFQVVIVNKCTNVFGTYDSCRAIYQQWTSQVKLRLHVTTCNFDKHVQIWRVGFRWGGQRNWQSCLHVCTFNVPPAMMYMQQSIRRKQSYKYAFIASLSSRRKCIQLHVTVSLCTRSSISLRCMCMAGW